MHSWLFRFDKSRINFESQGDWKNKKEHGMIDFYCILMTNDNTFIFSSNRKQLSIQRGSSTVIGILWKKLQIICFNTNGIWPQTKGSI